MVCKKCGNENPDGTIFCINCGNKLEEEIINQNVEVPTSNEESGITNNVGINQDNAINSMETNMNEISTNNEIGVNNDINPINDVSSNDTLNVNNNEVNNISDINTPIENSIPDESTNVENTINEVNTNIEPNINEESVNVENNINEPSTNVDTGVNELNTNVETNVNEVNNNSSIEPSTNDLNNNNVNMNYQTNNVGSTKTSKPKKGFNVKLLFIVIILLALIGVCLYFFVFKKSSTNDNVENVFDNDLIIIEKNGKYGYIDSTGKVIIEPKYDEASDYYGDYALVKENNDALIIDKKGNIKLKPEVSHSVSQVSNVWIVYGTLYDKSLNKLSADDEYVKYEKEDYLTWENDEKKQGGIMNTSGKKTYTYDFQKNNEYVSIDLSVSDNNAYLKDKYCKVRINYDKFAIVNCDSGKVILDYIEDHISSEGNNIFEIYDKDTDDTLYYVYIQGDKIVYKTENLDIMLLDNDIYKGYILIYDSKNHNDVGYIDIKTGNVVQEPPVYGTDELFALDDWEISTGLTDYYCDGIKTGLKKNGKVVVDCSWNRFEYLDMPLYKYLESKGTPYILAIKDEKMYLVSTIDGTVVKEFNTEYVSTYEDSSFVTYRNESKELVIYNLITGKSLTLDNYDDYDIYSNNATVKVDGKVNYYNTDLQLIYTFEA